MRAVYSPALPALLRQRQNLRSIATNGARSQPRQGARRSPPIRCRSCAYWIENPWYADGARPHRRQLARRNLLRIQRANVDDQRLADCNKILDLVQRMRHRR